MAPGSCLGFRKMELIEMDWVRLRKKLGKVFGTMDEAFDEMDDVFSEMDRGFSKMKSGGGCNIQESSANGISIRTMVKGKVVTLWVNGDKVYEESVK